MMSTSQSFHFKVGAIDCIAINDGQESLPAETIIRDVPLDTWKEALVAGGFSSTGSTVYFNVLYLNTGEHRLLVDAGWGKGVQRRDGALLDILEAEGIAPTEIDTIFLTHQDVDHFGGILTSTGGLTFPNAAYLLPQAAWDFWNNAALVSRWPEFLTTFARQGLPVIRDRVQVIKAGEEFWPGFTSISAPGHRPGHSALWVTSAGENLLHLGDVIGHPLLLEHPTWAWSADFQPAQAEKDKQLLLNQAASLNALVFGAHLPFPATGRLIPLPTGWRWVPLTSAS